MILRVPKSIAVRKQFSGVAFPNPLNGYLTLGLYCHARRPEVGICDMGPAAEIEDYQVPFLMLRWRSASAALVLG
jgi:hypothetical protein